MADPFLAAVLESLPAIDEPSPRAKRIAAGIALIRAGKPISIAAKEVDIPLTTLWENNRRVLAGETISGGRAELIKDAEQEIETLALAATIKAAQKIIERLDDDSMRPSEEIKAMQVMRDTVAMRLDWNRSSRTEEQSSNALADALNRLRERLPEPPPQARTIEAERVE